MSGSIIVVDDDNLICIQTGDTGDLESLGNTQVARASNVMPAAWPKRIAFRAIRKLVSDESRIAGWTRTWRGRWIADMGLSGGPVLRGADGKGFALRADALAAEVEWINKEVLHVV